MIKSHTYDIIYVEVIKVSEVTKGRGYVYTVQYHIVWCVKYRHKILIDKIEKKLQEIVYQIAKDNGFTIIEYKSASDHVHLLVDCKPQHYIPDMLKALKGTSARHLMKEFEEELRPKLWSGHLWSPSYFVATSSSFAHSRNSTCERTEEQIKKYIQNQQQKDG